MPELAEDARPRRRRTVAPMLSSFCRARAAPRTAGPRSAPAANPPPTTAGGARGGERLVTDAEVFQEILHRYAVINRRDAIQVAFDALLGVVDEVFPIELVDAERAKGVVLERSSLSARDAIHVAVMERRRVSQILSFDAGFDQIPGIVRLA